MQYITFFSICILNERNITCSVWVVLNGDDLSKNPYFITFEINSPKISFLLTPLMTDNYLSAYVSAGMFLFNKFQFIHIFDTFDTSVSFETFRLCSSRLK